MLTAGPKTIFVSAATLDVPKNASSAQARIHWTLFPGLLSVAVMWTVFLRSAFVLGQCEGSTLAIEKNRDWICERFWEFLLLEKEQAA